MCDVFLEECDPELLQHSFLVLIKWDADNLRDRNREFAFKIFKPCRAHSNVIFLDL